jgi:hypothetical protein
MARTRLWVVFPIVILLLVVVSSARSSQPNRSFGVRAGFGIDPDQFVFGVQAVLGRTMKIARIAPSADIGLGDDVTVLAFNLDARLSLTPPGTATAFYCGIGPTIAVFDPKKGGGDTEIGLSIAPGLRFPLGSKQAYNAEVRFGIGDVPDLKIMVGVLFGGGSKGQKAGL